MTFNNSVCFLLINLVLITASAPVFAAWTVKKGGFVNAKEVATLSPRDHYDIAFKAMEEKDWNTAAINFNIVANCFPLSTYAVDSHYYLGVALYNQGEFEFANDEFSAYMISSNDPKYFFEALEYKFLIAEAFKDGACRRFFKTKQMPKWASAQGLGLTIYDEVIAALPSHELATRALYSKATLLVQMKQYRESIDSLQLLIKRFPKHELAPKSYLLISQIYLTQSKSEFQNPDILAFAEINVRRFKQQFPREERIIDAENSVLAIKEAYAKGLYDTGQFYERTEKPRASIIYYQNAINQFPETSVAKLCEERLNYFKGLR